MVMVILVSTEISYDIDYVFLLFYSGMLNVVKLINSCFIFLRFLFLLSYFEIKNYQITVYQVVRKQQRCNLEVTLLKNSVHLEQIDKVEIYQNWRIVVWYIKVMRTTLHPRKDSNFSKVQVNNNIMSKKM